MNAANDAAWHPLFHAEIELDAEWHPISAYDKTTAPAVLLRGEGQAVFGVWSIGHVQDDEVAQLVWRSLEDSTLDSPLWFEPTDFAELRDLDEQFFLRR